MRIRVPHLVLSLASLSFSWVVDKTYWTFNPTFETNTSNPTDMRASITDGIRTVAGAGGFIYPKQGGTTGRDCAAGDSWFSDDDDGHNVIDWWDKCNDNSHWNINCYSSTAAGTFFVDLYNNGGYEAAEVDIVVCSNKTYWTTALDMIPNMRSYRRTVTHELGHAMNLNHSDRPTLNPTMRDGATAEESAASQTLHWDDVGGLRAVSGSCNIARWTTVSTSGQQVTVNNGAGCGLDISIKVNPTNPPVWTVPISMRNATLGGFVYKAVNSSTGATYPNSFLRWEEYDRNHSLIVTAIVVGFDNVERELNYARNASNWWANEGWVNMSANNPGYFFWQAIDRDLTADHESEYGIKPKYIKEILIKHFAYTGWATGVNHGGQVRNLRIERP